MDTYDADGSDFEPESESDDKHLLVDARQRTRTSRPPDAQAKFSSISKLSGKWKGLQRYYNDGYNDLFQRSLDTDIPEAFPKKAETSQLGAVIWTSTEKERLFQGLQTRGRHDLPALSRLIGTKSPFEVRAYLEILQQAELDQQRFEKQTRNISLAEIPAATEVGVDCEMKLERAADALAAYQEQYDFAMGQQGSSLPFIITRDAAKTLDARSDGPMEHFSDDDSSADEVDLQIEQPHELFNLRNLLELSQKLFMHGSQDAPENNWREFAEQDETPAITQRAVSDLQDLVVSFLQRVIQTALFLAQSRVRATTIHDHKPSHSLQPEDIHTALKILNLKKDAWKYWIRLARRFPFRVVKGTHRKGDSIKGALNYDEVEAALSVRRFSGRRRSLSVMSGMSDDTDVPSSTGDSQSDAEEEPSSTSEFGESASDVLRTSTDDDMQDSEDSLDAEPSDPVQDRQTRVPPNRRKRQLEEELDEYVEAMDQQARRQEESRLLSLLGQEVLQAVKQEPLVFGRRPKVLRKSVEDVTVWTSTVLAAWEAYPHSEPSESITKDNIDVLTQKEGRRDDSEVSLVQHDG